MKASAMNVIHVKVILFKKVKYFGLITDQMLTGTVIRNVKVAGEFL